MSPVALDGAGDGGRLATRFADESHVGLMPTSQVVMVEESGMQGIDRRCRASDRTVATQARMYFGLRCRMKKMN